jgi:putative transposase
MPTPFAQILTLSPKQHSLLKQIANRPTNPYRLVSRAKLILAAQSGMNNTKISQQLKLHRRRVREWRQKWIEASERLDFAESEGATDKELRQLIEQILSDEKRSGTPNYFSTETVVQIVALACSEPKSSSRPISHWTPKELAAEAIKRGIVERISPRSVGRFLKRSDTSTSPSSLLAKR